MVSSVLTSWSVLMENKSAMGVVLYRRNSASRSDSLSPSATRRPRPFRCLKLGLVGEGGDASSSQPSASRNDFTRSKSISRIGATCAVMPPCPDAFSLTERRDPRRTRLESFSRTFKFGRRTSSQSEAMLLKLDHGKKRKLMGDVFGSTQKRVAGISSAFFALLAPPLSGSPCCFTRVFYPWGVWSRWWGRFRGKLRGLFMRVARKSYRKNTDGRTNVMLLWPEMCSNNDKWMIVPTKMVRVLNPSGFFYGGLVLWCSRDHEMRQNEIFV